MTQSIWPLPSWSIPGCGMKTRSRIAARVVVDGLGLAVLQHRAGLRLRDAAAPRASAASVSAPAASPLTPILIQPSVARTRRRLPPFGVKTDGEAGVSPPNCPCRRLNGALIVGRGRREDDLLELVDHAPAEAQRGHEALLAQLARVERGPQLGQRSRGRPRRRRPWPPRPARGGARAGARRRAARSARARPRRGPRAGSRPSGRRRSACSPRRRAAPAPWPRPRPPATLPASSARTLSSESTALCSSITRAVKRSRSVAVGAHDHQQRCRGSSASGRSARARARAR